MRHSIFSVILSGIIIGALFFFMPILVLGIFIFLFIIRLLHIGYMSHRWYGPGYYGHHGYRYGCDCGYGYGYREGDESRGSEHDKDYDSHHHHNHDHHHGHGSMEGPLYYWADKIRNMSEEDYSGFKDKMKKGFGHGYYGGRPESYDRCECGRKREADSDSNSDTKKEDTTQNNESK